MKFKDKIIWITGASSGIGEAMAYAFAKRGAILVLSARNEEALEKVKNNCPKDTEILILPLDVSDYEAAEVAGKKVIDHFGKVDFLINNAGISQREVALKTKFEVDKKIMDVNFLGTVAVTKSVLANMVEQGSGHIVVMSSILGKIGTPMRSAYAGSKHALHGYFDSLRSEVENKGLNVTIICLGYVHTNVTVNALKGDGTHNAKLEKSSAKGMEPDEFAEKAIKVIAHKHRERLIGGKEVLAVQLKRFFPWIFNELINKYEVN